MKGSKVYLLWSRHYDLIECYDRLISIFDNKAEAEACKAGFDGMNDCPVVQDDYGPLNGIEYFIEEKEIE